MLRLAHSIRQPLSQGAKAQFHASSALLVGQGARPKKSPYMNWKRRQALDLKEKEYYQAIRTAAGDHGDASEYEGPFSLRPIDDDAKEITYDDLMAMLFNEDDTDETSSADKEQQKMEWRSSRKFVDVNALFAPR